MSPEGVVFVSVADSPTGKPLVIVANELSGTTTIYEVTGSEIEAELAVANVTLPATGQGTDMALVAAVMLGIGAVALMVGRRRV